jgi:glycosyltransferase involved in cell wall biosynthesis
MIQQVCAGVESDPRLIRSFARQLTQAGVTHAMGTIELLAPFINAARAYVPYQLQTIVQFQGYETYAPFAARIGLEQAMYDRIREAVDSSGLPAISVSEPYAERIECEIGLPVSQQRIVHPGIPITAPVDLQQAQDRVAGEFPDFNRALPLISYLGRRDSEKGIDLLIYATQILRQKEIPFQLAICGPTAFGSRYGVACRQIAQVLKMPVLSSDFVSNELRSSLFRASRCLVYPSIHTEPFGMVPLEAMVQGTPVIVPDTGGVSRLPFLGHLQSGLLFRSWDSGDLADQLERLVTDNAMHRRFAADAPRIAAHYSVENSANWTLDHLGLPHWPGQQVAPGTRTIDSQHRRAA